jgi:hypothetical protein
MVFTAVSRSRNSGNPTYHRRWAYLSNSVWLVCQFFIWKHFWAAFNSQEYWAMALMGVIYTLSTAEGSVYMMKKMLAKEKGNKKVGANDELEKQLKAQETDINSLKQITARLKLDLDSAIYESGKRKSTH